MTAQSRPAPAPTYRPGLGVLALANRIPEWFVALVIRLGGGAVRPPQIDKEEFEDRRRALDA